MSDFIWFLLNILRTNRQNKTKFCIHIIIDKIYNGILSRCFSQICNRVTALNSRQNLVFTQYLENELTEWNHIFVHIFIDKIYVGIVNRCFSQICNRVTAFDPRQNLNFAQYLENEWTEFNQSLYIHWEDLRWDCKASVFENLQQSYNPWLTPEFGLCSISWEYINRIKPNFVYSSSLTRSRSGLLCTISFSNRVMPLYIFVLWKRYGGATVRSSDNSGFCLDSLHSCRQQGHA